MMRKLFNEPFDILRTDGPANGANGKGGRHAGLFDDVDQYLDPMAVGNPKPGPSKIVAAQLAISPRFGGGSQRYAR
jgi:hypothetical protein